MHIIRYDTVQKNLGLTVATNAVQPYRDSLVKDKKRSNRVEADVPGANYKNDGASHLAHSAFGEVHCTSYGSRSSAGGERLSIRDRKQVSCELHKEREAVYQEESRKTSGERRSAVLQKKRWE